MSLYCYYQVIIYLLYFVRDTEFRISIVYSEMSMSKQFRMETQQKFFQVVFGIIIKDTNHLIISSSVYFWFLYNRECIVAIIFGYACIYCISVTICPLRYALVAF